MSCVNKTSKPSKVPVLKPIQVGLSPPDFKKVHKEWAEKFVKKVASNKKSNTKIEEFKITRSNLGQNEKNRFQSNSRNTNGESCEETSPFYCGRSQFERATKREAEKDTSLGVSPEKKKANLANDERQLFSGNSGTATTGRSARKIDLFARKSPMSLEELKKYLASTKKSNKPRTLQKGNLSTDRRLFTGNRGTATMGRSARKIDLFARKPPMSLEDLKKYLGSTNKSKKSEMVQSEINDEEWFAASPDLPSRVDSQTQLYSRTVNCSYQVHKTDSQSIIKTLKFNDDEFESKKTVENEIQSDDGSQDENSPQVDQLASSLSEAKLCFSPSQITIDDPKERDFLVQVKKDIERTASFLKTNKQKINSQKSYSGIERMNERLNRKALNPLNLKNHNIVLEESIPKPVLSIKRSKIKFNDSPVPIFTKKATNVVTPTVLSQPTHIKPIGLDVSSVPQVLKSDAAVEVSKTPRRAVPSTMLMDTPSLVKSLRMKLTGQIQ